MDPDLVERCAQAGRKAFAEFDPPGGRDLVPWEKSEAREAWRVVAEAVLAEAARGPAP